MQRRLAAEGIWVEPASATGLAGLASKIQSGHQNPRGQCIVAVCTGHGLKDPDIITRQMAQPTTIPHKIEALEEVIEYYNIEPKTYFNIEWVKKRIKELEVR